MSVSFDVFFWTAQIPCGKLSNLQPASWELSIGRGLERRADGGGGRLFWSVYRLYLPVFSMVSQLSSVPHVF